MTKKEYSNKHKKQYGQVFSGEKVADLLALLLPDSFKPIRVCDPMVGIGDLLIPICRIYKPEYVAGIDIDTNVINRCKKNVPCANIVAGDSFNYRTLEVEDGWDLIITNPPYIRYQLLNDENNEIPSASEVRKNLLEYIKNADYLNTDEKNLLEIVGKNYSGLSDLSVPSWVLCSSMLGTNGYLAMVVPETLFTRDYALPIQYLLLKMFDIECVVKNVDASWFQDASVRTCLVVARKKKVDTLSLAVKKKTFLIEITEKIAGDSSLIEKLCYKRRRNDDALKAVLSEQPTFEQDGFRCKRVDTLTLFSGFCQKIDACEWTGEYVGSYETASNLPSELYSLIGGLQACDFWTIEEMGWSIGQGLRTGANQFFYCDILSESLENYKVRTQEWNDKEIDVEKGLVFKTLQKRSDIEGNVAKYEKIKKGIFYIQDRASKEDLKRVSDKYKQLFKSMDSEMERYITAANQYVLPSGKAFRDMSAVKTNIKKDKEGYTGFWYMLPKLQHRHLPNICIQRVCGKGVESLFVEQSEDYPIIVDANFTTLWNGNKEQAYILFSLLNSLWFQCYSELVATVMGGGALKLEATHVRKIMFPVLSSKQQKKLAVLGKKLVDEDKNKAEVIREIDGVVFSAFGSNADDELIYQVRRIVERKQKERGV